MKVTELTQEQLEKIADINPSWMSIHYISWMSDNRPEYMADNRPEYMSINRRVWMAEYRQG